MSEKRNFVASVKGRLLYIAKTEGKNHQLLLLRYFQERFLYRVSKSGYKDNFCLKGAAFLYALQKEKSRVTKDIDFLGLNIPNRHDQIRQVVTEICHINYEDDGVLFDTETIAIEDIIKDGNYKGIRVNVTGFLNRTKQRIQIDMGFGDIVVPNPLLMTYPVILEMEAPILLAYSIESSIAEKFEAMIDLGETNTRMKDYYDVHQLIKNEVIDDQLLEQAIKATFIQRQTAMPVDHSLFSPEFYEDEIRLNRWKAWLRKINLDQNLDFSGVLEEITRKLKPIYLKLASQNT